MFNVFNIYKGFVAMKSPNILPVHGGANYYIRPLGNSVLSENE